MSMAVAYFHKWTAAMDVLGLPDLGTQADLLADVGRHSRDLSAAVAGIARTLPGLDRGPVVHALAWLRCPVGVLQEIDRLVDDDQLAARGFLVETMIGDRAVRAPGPLARFDPPLWQRPRPAPRLDEHGPALRSEAARPQNKARPSKRKGAGAGPLHGVRVLSLGQAWSGTFGTELLALLGADVVQISAVDRHDSWRRVGTGVPKAVIDSGRLQHALDTQGLYNSVNLNKREITLDLAQDEERRIFWQLLPRFDVLVDNFRPTVLPAWGVTMEALAGPHPGFIWASLSGYGADGPYREYPAIGSTIEPMSGLSSLLGYDGDLGMNTGGLYPDPVSGYGYDATGRVPRPMGNHHPRVAPHNYYRARCDEWLAVAADDGAAWAPAKPRRRWGRSASARRGSFLSMRSTVDRTSIWWRPDSLRPWTIPRPA
jgi:crotonobetainyl-CoA:carnitine CoA-transferase CaiB-like acyl-CoA transferase